MKGNCEKESKKIRIGGEVRKDIGWRLAKGQGNDNK